MKILLLYSGKNGQTRAIASYIANILQSVAVCDVIDLLDAGSVDLKQYQQVIIGAAVHYGHFNVNLFRFVNQHIEQLSNMPSAFFAVNLTARKPEKRSPQTNSYVRKFFLHTPWKPQVCAVFAGALCYPCYGWFDRVMIQLIMRMTGGETDTTKKKVEYTDWHQVDDFAKNLMILQ